MAHSVVDHTSNVNEQIEQAALLLGRSTSQKCKVFQAVYRGQKRKKSVTEVMAATGLNQRRVLDAGRVLASHGLVAATKVGMVTSYHKVPFFVTNRNKVLKYAGSPTRLKKLPTKRRPETVSKQSGERVQLTARLPKAKAKAVRITVDDIASFSPVRKISDQQSYSRLSETSFKRGVAKILGEKGTFKDWGGENRDLASSKLRVDSTKRQFVAFAFKGPGMSGKLVPGKMGKNGDQIQRLALRCDAQVFLVQYWGEIDDSVPEQLGAFARLRAYFLNEKVWYGTIDGVDSTRIIKAFPRCFPKPKTKG